MVRRVLALLAVLASVLIATSGLALPASAGDPEGEVILTVDTTDDVVDAGDGLTSLREAVSAANASPSNQVEVLLVPGAVHVLDRCGAADDDNERGDLDHTAMDQAITLRGAGATVRQTCAGERVLHSLAGDVDVVEATITGGRSTGVDAEGGGLRADVGSIDVRRGALVDNHSAGAGGGAWAGGPNGDVTVRSSLVEGNVADSTGGGLWAGDEVFVRQSTLVDNEADNFGGAAFADRMHLDDSTVVDNRATDAGAARAAAGSIYLATTTNVYHPTHDAGGASVDASEILSTLSVVAPSTLPTSGVACSTDATSVGASYDTDGTCGFTDTPTDVSAGGPPQLGPLQDNGGLTPTRAPIPSSPLVDVLAPDGDLCNEDSPSDGDQRGVGRPQGAGCDIGAVETPLPFVDVGLSSPFFAEIAYLERTRITNGFPDGTYRPNGSVSRQAIAAFLFRLAGDPDHVAGPKRFSDVSPSHPFFREIDWLVQEDITTGYADGRFRPSAPVTRQAIAAFFFRLAEAEADAPASPTFTDVPAGHPFFDEVEWLRATGMTTGYSDGTFRPGSTMTRQAMAAFLYRAIEVAEIVGGPG